MGVDRTRPMTPPSKGEIAKRVFERQVRELASGVLGRPESASLDGYPEADLGVGLGRPERMFLQHGCGPLTLKSRSSRLAASAVDHYRGRGR
jgi:hypothetical protein